MKRKKLIFLATISLPISIFIGNILYDRFDYAEERIIIETSSKKTNPLKLGIIGDSWVGRYHLDKWLEKELANNGKSVEILAFSNPGGRTKEIYQNLFKNENELYSSNKILKENPQYCVIMAGINDAARHMGKDYYAHHITLILNTLLKQNITPIVLELTKFGVEENYYSKGILSKYGNKFSEYIDGNNQIDNIDAYRDFLNKELKINNLSDKIIFIDVDRLEIDYTNHKELYTDPLHLNKQGYKKLVKGISNEIIKISSK